MKDLESRIAAVVISREKKDVQKQFLQQLELGRSLACCLSELSIEACERAAADIEKWSLAEIEVIARGTQFYPIQLEHLSFPPWCLYWRGSLRIVSLELAISIIGSRAATPQSCDFARRCGRFAAQVGVTVVSGLALGVDAAAHWGVVQSGAGNNEHLVALAVLGNGVDRIYPARHRQLAHELLELGGAIVSEFEPGVAPLPHHFLQRNQIIAALSGSLLVVAAAERSGSLNTVRYALELGREVLTVPGSVLDAGMSGCNKLLQQGAGVVLCPEDLQDLWPTLSQAGKVGGLSAKTSLEEYLKQRRFVHLDDLTRLFPEVSPADLLGLELAGVIEQVAGVVRYLS